jgi:hypothetical protein
MQEWPTTLAARSSSHREPILCHYTGSMVRVLHPVPIERIKLLVFDLDGTLIDSAQDLCNSVNATLTRFGFDRLADTAIAGFIGDGALMLVRRAFAEAAGGPVDEDFLAAAYDFFLDYYRAHKLDFTYAYAGVLEALAALHKIMNRRRKRQNHGRADQQAGSPGTRHLRGAGPGALLPPHLRRQQL